VRSQGGKKKDCPHEKKKNPGRKGKKRGVGLRRPWKRGEERAVAAPKGQKKKPKRENENGNTLRKRGD